MQSIKTALQKSSVLFEVAVSMIVTCADSLICHRPLTCPLLFRQFVVTVQLATKFIDSEGKPCNFHSDATAILAPQLSEYLHILTMTDPRDSHSRTHASVRRGLTARSSPASSSTGELWMPAKTRRLLLFFGGGSPISPAMRRCVSALSVASSVRSLD